MSCLPVENPFVSSSSCIYVVSVSEDRWVEYGVGGWDAMREGCVDVCICDV